MSSTSHYSLELIQIVVGQHLSGQLPNLNFYNFGIKMKKKFFTETTVTVSMWELEGVQ